MGHFAMTCPYRYVKADHNDLSKSFAGLHVSSSPYYTSPSPFISAIDNIESQWVANSDATSHMTSNPTLPQQPTLFSGN